ncbi:hypothetical protein GOODEAATRI_013256 [Goodea atripinnis]|uniref:Uncharacterized protein n=1 Tax=Goodea atripinnis TaxID=208336 RepID=A0ABV0NUA3_9TELE
MLTRHRAGKSESAETTERQTGCYGNRSLWQRGGLIRLFAKANVIGNLEETLLLISVNSVNTTKTKQQPHVWKHLQPNLV